MKINRQSIFSFLAALFILSTLILPLMATATAPVVLTDNATEITYDSAKVNGQITDHGRHNTGYYNQSQIWFEYGPTVAYGSKTTTRTIISLNSFTESLAGLSQCSVYHFRAVAQNESEKSYGQDRVFTTLCQTQVKISVLTQNLSQGGPYAEKTTIQEGDTFSTKIIIESTGSSMAKNVSLKVVLPPNTIYNNNLIIAGLADGRDITSQVISLGDLAPKESKTISFQARVDKAVNLPTGLNTLIGTILVYTTESANSASFTLFQSGTGAGAASNVGQPTNVNTGIVSDLAYSVLLPLIMALGIVYLFRSKLLGLDKVLSERKLKVDDFRANKQLKKAIRKRIKQ